MIIYSKWLVPKGFDAITVWPFIFMDRPDPALLQHEMVHYKEQAWITPFWWLYYLFNKSFRITAEAKAYAVQVDAGALTPIRAANWLMKYDKELTVEEAVQLLEAYYHIRT